MADKRDSISTVRHPCLSKQGTKINKYLSGDQIKIGKRQARGLNKLSNITQQYSLLREERNQFNYPSFCSAISSFFLTCPLSVGCNLKTPSSALIALPDDQTRPHHNERINVAKDQRGLRRRLVHHLWRQGRRLSYTHEPIIIVRFVLRGQLLTSSHCFDTITDIAVVELHRSNNTCCSAAPSSTSSCRFRRHPSSSILEWTNKFQL